MLPPPQTIRRPSICPRHAICPRGRAVAFSEVRHAEHRASKMVPATAALCGIASLRLIENERINQRRAREPGSTSEPCDEKAPPERGNRSRSNNSRGAGDETRTEFPQPNL